MNDIELKGFNNSFLEGYNKVKKEQIKKKAKYFVCKIKNNRDGTGFFFIFLDPENEDKTMVALFTCNHVLPINNTYKQISYILNNQEEHLCVEDGRRIWTYIDETDHRYLDYTCIEIFPKNSNLDIVFEIDKKTLNNQNYKELKNIKIKAYTYTDELEKITGEIQNWEEKEEEFFYHTLETKDGYSGSPIINKNDGNIIGIHQGKKKIGSKEKRIGMNLKTIYESMKSNEHKIKIENRKEKQKTQFYQEGIIYMIKQHWLALILIILAIVISIIFINQINNPAETNFEYFFKEDDKNYNSFKYYNDSCKINKTGNYDICVYGAKANSGGRGGKVCINNENFEKNDKIEYRLGRRDAGGQGGRTCGKSENKGKNGAGMALAKYKNKNILIAGGGGGDSESNNKGGDAESNGNGKNAGKGAKENIPGKGGVNAPSGGNCGEEEDGGKGGNGGESYISGKWCGGGGGDGFCGGGGGGYGDKGSEAGGGGGGSNYCSSEIKKKCSLEINKESTFSGIKISKVD